MKKILTLLLFYSITLSQFNLQNYNWDLRFSEPFRGNGVNGTVSDVFVLDDNIFIAGGFALCNLDEDVQGYYNIVKYNFSTYSFTPLAPLTTGGNTKYRLYEGAIKKIVTIGNKIYCCNYNNSSLYNVLTGNIQSYVKLFTIDLNTLEWEVIPNVPSDLIFGEVYAMKLVGSTGLLFGGRFDNIYYYNTSTNTFTTIPFKIDAYNQGAYVSDIQVVDDSLVYVVGNFNKPHKGIAKINLNDFSSSSLGVELEPNYYSIYFYNNYLYLQGSFISLNDIDGIKNIVGLAKLNLITKKWSKVANLTFTYDISTYKIPTNIYGFSKNLFLLGDMGFTDSTGFYNSTANLIQINLDNEKIVNTIKDFPYYQTNLKFYDLYKYIVFGNFTNITGIPFNNIALFKINKLQFEPIGKRGGLGLNGEIYKTLIKDNKLYVVGNFTKAGLTPSQNLAYLDLTDYEWYGLGLYRNNKLNQDDINGKIYAIEADSNYIYIGGEFTKIKDKTISGLAKYNLKTQQWSTITGDNSSYNFGYVYDLKLANNKLYIGGLYQNTISSTNLKNISYYDITQNKLFPIGTGLNNGVNGQVNTIEIIGDYLYVAGDFNSAGQILAPKIAKFNLTSMQWETLGNPPANGTDKKVNIIKLFNNKLYIGGEFNSAGNNPNYYFSIYNLLTNNWEPNTNMLIQGFNSGVNTIHPFKNGIFIGGSFTDYYAQNNNNLNKVVYYDNTTNSFLPLTINGVTGLLGGVTTINNYNDDIIFGGYFTQTATTIDPVNTYKIAILKNNLLKNENITKLSDFKIVKNYPNPFNPSTNIVVNIPKQGELSLRLYNLIGQELFSKQYFLPEGLNTINLNMTGYDSGVYIYSLKFNGIEVTSKILLLK
jgi:hypothetical protein